MRCDINAEEPGCGGLGSAPFRPSPRCVGTSRYGECAEAEDENKNGMQALKIPARGREERS